MTIFEADWVCPVSAPPLHNGSLAVEGEKIIAAGPTHRGKGERVSFPGCAIIPGFVNAHAHLELTVLRGFLEDIPFDAWISRLTRAKYQQLTRHEIIQSARLGAIETPVPFSKALEEGFSPKGRLLPALRKLLAY